MGSNHPTTFISFIVVKYDIELSSLSDSCRTKAIQPYIGRPIIYLSPVVVTSSIDWLNFVQPVEFFLEILFSITCLLHQEDENTGYN